MFGTDDYWIVRCPSASTLLLADKLREIGFDVWTPVVEREYRKARSKKYVRVREPMLSTFLFIKMGANAEQCAQRLDDVKWLYGIRIMRNNGEYAGVRAEELQGLRDLEREAATFGIDNLVKADQFEIGQVGTINSEAFSGLTCTLVDRSRGNLLVLLEGAANPITVKAVLFRPNEPKRK